MSLFGMDQVLRVKLWFKERAMPQELLVSWAPDAPMPAVSAVVEAMFDGVLVGVDGEAIAWDDGCVEMMTVNLVPSLHLQIGNG